MIISLLGGPGVGKSTLAYSLMAELKKMNFSVEYVSEYNLGQGKHDQDDQISIAIKQMQELNKFYGKVNYIITDPSILLPGFYYEKNGGTGALSRLMTEHLHRVRKNNDIEIVNIFLPFDKKDKTQTEKNANQIDDELEEWFKKNAVPFHKMTCKTPDRVRNIMGLLNLKYAKVK